MNTAILFQRLQSKQASMVNFAGNSLVADASGALFWPSHNMLLVSDLHFEKGSFLASHGNPIPHYDSRKTLQSLTAVIATYLPRHVLCLGDSFHDHNAWQRLPHEEQGNITKVVEMPAQWTWILGNHDPDLPSELPGAKVAELVIDNLLFLHEPDRDDRQDMAQVFGHFHPKMTKTIARQRISGRCFMYDNTRLVLPAFGAYTGGLSVKDPALSDLFNHPNVNQQLMYQGKIYPL